MKITLYPKYLIRSLFVHGRRHFFKAGYKVLYPEYRRHGMTPWQHYVVDGKRKGFCKGNEPSDQVFFREGYELEYPDVSASGYEPWRHYAEKGYSEGRDNGLHPGEKMFFPEGYLEMYPDVAKSGLDPWHHYVLKGKKEGRDSGLHPKDKVFFAAGYLEMYPDIAKSGLDPWHHYVLKGKQEGRDNGNHPNPATFIPEVYLALNDDVRNAKIDPWVHFATSGRKEKRLKSSFPYFDEEYYLEHYPQVRDDPDVKSGEMTPEAHYFLKGWKLGYDPSLNFDTRHYLGKYRDVRERQICPLTHFLAVGRFQDRQPYPSHDLEPKTITELPEPFMSGGKPSECRSVKLSDTEDRALLIMLAEHLGDIVATEPIARYLKWKYPDRPLYWVVESRFRDIVRYNPFLSGYIEVNSLKECIELNRNISGGQKIINLFFNGRPDRRPPKYFWYAREHGIGFNNYLANDCLLSAMSMAAGLDRLLIAPRFWESPEYLDLSREEIFAKAGLAEILKKTVAKNGRSRLILLHTKSNDATKDWPAEKFSDLTDKILQLYPDAVVAELGMSSVVKSDCERYVSMASINDLQLIYQVIKNSDLLVGIESSFLHMANAGGIQAVNIMGTYGLFSHHCTYSGRYWNGDGITFVRAGEGKTSPAVEVSEVLKAVKSRL